MNIHEATSDIVTEGEAFFAKLKSVIGPATVKTVQNDFHTAESAAWTYIKTNGLEDLYALAIVLLKGPAGVGGWSDLLAALLKQATADGKQIAAGAVAVVAAQAQADGIVSGNVAAPMATPAQ